MVGLSETIILRLSRVGFTLKTTVDDGKSVISRAGRVSKEYTGKGIAGIMLKWVDKGGPLYRPEVLCHKTTRHRTLSPLLQLINKGTYNKTLEQHIVIRNENPSLKADSIDEKVLSEILASTDHKQYLFPGDEIVVDFVPYRAIKSNTPLIMMSEYILIRGTSSKGTSLTFLDSAVEEFGFKRTGSYGTGLIGFTLITTVDDGRSVVTRAVRVSKEYAGKGNARIMLQWLDKEGPLHRPEVVKKINIDSTLITLKLFILSGIKVVLVYVYGIESNTVHTTKQQKSTFEFILQFLRHPIPVNVITMDNNIRCKRVTKEDYEKVMAVFPPSEIYYGSDYLSDNFHMLIDMPNNEMYAAVIGDTFVGFTLMTTVDDGKSVVTRAGRVSKEYAGKGIAGIMLKWMDKGGPLYRPEVLWHKTTGSRTHSPLLQLINKGTYNKTLEQDFRFYDTHNGTLQTKYNVIKNKSPSLKAEYIDVNLFGQVLASTDHKQYLFPEDEIVVENIPYRAIKSNAPLIISKRTTVVVSDLNCPKRALLSVSNFHQAPIGMFFNFNVYGCLSENIKEHLIFHFAKFLCRPMSQYILLRGISSKGTSWTFLDSAVEELGFKRTEFYGTGLVSVRRRILSKL
ncbi:HISAT [Mytilus coruscus]|uniref:HISAT n=1 Tax=Mytilus coruscus TaxID=42192 RepID=A0A6J8APG9_MYTCO|nr:HISAT [Mytilus coruscus]